MAQSEIKAPASKPLQLKDIHSASVQELHEREIAIELSVLLPKTYSDAKLNACIGKSFQDFPQEFKGSLADAIFTKKELEDLKDCEVTDCAFRFRPDERAELERLKDSTAIQKKVYEFYAQRARDRVLPYSWESEFRLDSTDKGFPFCQHPDFSELLKNRKHKNAQNKIQVVRGTDKRMRPTTRLSRSLRYTGKAGEICYADVLLFSNHYDLDRIEVWGVAPADPKKPRHLRLLVRQRIDFLNSWWRRLRKGDLRDALEGWGKKEVLDTLQCLERS